MKILIIDDSQDKRSQICDVLTGMCGLSMEEIHQADDINKGRKLLFAHQYDLLILDLVLPTNHGEDIIPGRGEHFIEEFDRYARLNKPLVIIGLTAYEDRYEEMKEFYHEKLWDLILYRQSSTDWMGILQRAIQKVLDLRSTILKSAVGTDQFDVGIICARSEEFYQMKRAFDDQWLPLETPATIGMTLRRMELLNARAETVRLVGCCCGQTGMTATSAAATYLYTHFGVREIYMTGCCFGFPDLTKRGDLFVAASEYDYLQAKLDEEDGKSVAQLTPHTIPCSSNLRLQVETYIREKSFPYTIHVAGGVCGPHIVAREPILIETLLKHDPNFRGIDSEGYGLYAAQHMLGGDRSCLLIKTIAGLDDDECHLNESAYKSALFLRDFLRSK